MPKIKPTTNHLENENNGRRHSIEGGKQSKNPQNQQDIEKSAMSALQDRISGCVTHGTKPSPRPYLTAEEEPHIWLMYQSWDIEKQEKGTLSKEKGWWRRFIVWQSQFSLCQEDFAHVCMDAISQESFSRYFDLLKSTLKKHQLEDCPDQIYNMDETGMPLDPRSPNTIAKSGQKGKLQAVRQKGANKVIGCGNAIDQSIPPIVIFEGNYLNYEWWSTWNYLWYEWVGMDWPRAFSILAETLSKLSQCWPSFITAPGWALIPLWIRCYWVG